MPTGDVAGGALHTLLCVRVTDAAVNAAGAASMPAAGLHLEELFMDDDGPERPIWLFDEEPKRTGENGSAETDACFPSS